MVAEKKKRILIVDDDKTVCKIYRDMFMDAADRYEVETENDARIAFKRVQEEAFDLVSLDMIMEPMDGETFYSCMRADPKTKDIPVVVVSVLNPGDMEHLKKMGQVSFLQKPITQEQLLEQVERVLGN